MREIHFGNLLPLTGMWLEGVENSRPTRSSPVEDFISRNLSQGGRTSDMKEENDGQLRDPPAIAHLGLIGWLGGRRITEQRGEEVSERARKGSTHYKFIAFDR